jgi:formylmethanofuran dehydrogenase subunit B
VGAAYRLAAALGASVDPASAPALYGDLAALAGAGAVGTTPGEALARAELALAVGRAAGSAVVRDLAGSRPTMGPAAGADRRMRSLDGGEAGGLLPSLALLRAQAGGRLAPAGPLAHDLRTMRFGVAVYDPAELGDLGVEMLHGLAADLNEVARFFCVSLEDPWQGRVVQSVAAWTTGQAPRVGFGRERPEHDPWRFDGARQTASGEADAALWLASLPAPRPDWTRAVPCVAVLGQASADDGEVVIAVDRPGDTADGTLWHGRRGAMVFEPARNRGSGPVAAAVLRALEALIQPAEAR